MNIKIKEECPKCGSRIDRVRRMLIDRIICLFSAPFISLRRYRCFQCDWEGLKKK